MTAPRIIHAGSTYMITRRVNLRHYLLRPDDAINEYIEYSLAEAAAEHGIEIHAFCAMSTHIHLIATDTFGQLPAFLHCFHRIVAMGVKAIRKEWEGSVWDSGRTSVVELRTPAAVCEKIAYVLANPVSAGIVKRAHEWPGAKTTVDQIGRGELRARRPNIYFNAKKTAWPEEACIPITLPPMITPDQAEGFRRQVAEEIERLESVAHAEMKRKKANFWGVQKAKTISPYERARSQEPTYDRDPTFAVGRDQKDARRSAIEALRAFRTAYRRALEQWRAGVRTVVFPQGTWWMRVFHGAAVNDIAGTAAHDVAIAAA